jgi:hypothetical protein
VGPIHAQALDLLNLALATTDGGGSEAEAATQGVAQGGGAAGVSGAGKPSSPRLSPRSSAAARSPFASDMSEESDGDTASSSDGGGGGGGAGDSPMALSAGAATAAAAGHVASPAEALAAALDGGGRGGHSGGGGCAEHLLAVLEAIAVGGQTAHARGAGLVVTKALWGALAGRAEEEDKGRGGRNARASVLYHLAGRLPLLPSLGTGGASGLRFLAWAVNAAAAESTAASTATAIAAAVEGGGVDDDGLLAALTDAAVG